MQGTLCKATKKFICYVIFSARERTQQVFCNRLNGKKKRDGRKLFSVNKSCPDDVHSAREKVVFNMFVKTVKIQHMFVQNTQKDPNTTETQSMSTLK